jgi:hypothetical protein
VRLGAAEGSVTAAVAERCVDSCAVSRRARDLRGDLIGGRVVERGLRSNESESIQGSVKAGYTWLASACAPVSVDMHDSVEDSSTVSTLLLRLPDKALLMLGIRIAATSFGRHELERASGQRGPSRLSRSKDMDDAPLDASTDVVEQRDDLGLALLTLDTAVAPWKWGRVDRRLWVDVKVRDMSEGGSMLKDTCRLSTADFGADGEADWSGGAGKVCERLPSRRFGADGVGNVAGAEWRRGRREDRGNGSVYAGISGLSGGRSLSTHIATRLCVFGELVQRISDESNVP